MLLPAFEWLGSLEVSKALAEASLLTPLIQALHLVALAVFMGAVLVVDLRLLGHGLTAQPIARVARGARPWFVWSLAALVATGVPQLMSLAEKEYYSDYFWMKMYFFAAALLFTATVRARLTGAHGAGAGPAWAKVAGLVSIVLWSGVALAARLIGLL
jgi:hypothetical protein